ncbi:hypothetical protein [Geomicrobium sp. JCM 19039]|uniref:hypothetical protein n=1 Tax=Geomicrobium sp. JCM 19039 TaxID=1460636 RepID=UPI00045F2B23|nr:hypothetical protein [Geomicrobium sp. JCM 19039]GAK14680.1 hypothetical protein JCM19039_4620 [Geomicrobium sp. JCM 19039]
MYGISPLVVVALVICFLLYVGLSVAFGKVFSEQARNKKRVYTWTWILSTLSFLLVSYLFLQNTIQDHVDIYVHTNQVDDYLRTHYPDEAYSLQPEYHPSSGVGDDLSVHVKFTDSDRETMVVESNLSDGVVQQP